MAHLKEFSIHTGSSGFYGITRDVAAFVASTGVREGLCFVFCPHTTGGITINENADPDVTADLVRAYDRAFPRLPEFEHEEGNSDAHAKSAAVGAGETVIVHEGRLLLGTWQGLYFCEFDGPRHRRFYVKVVEG